ncbi:MAG: carbonic anhydrase [Nitrospirae bacterium RIFCSPLOW2_12_42_9]|nr:MAG: carbonic anhydrase [Nitrospirae bacterium GWA2_42_11]OGW59617.1 MAG: carbonic anhydrase [Nitrospirae bacterium RIFCSPLOW2_12_42_9]HBI22641.1 carbonic anhydrase [Nitrospiraceae bacterium]
MDRIVPINSADDIFPQYKGTPVGHLLEYHNLGFPFKTHLHAEILIGMCMDYREELRIPDEFAYVIRAGGGNLRHSEFYVSYAIAVGGVSSIALFTHTDCGMVNVMSRKERFISGLVEKAGCNREWAERLFMSTATSFEIGNEIDFVLSEANRLRKVYPKILVAPMLYRVEDDLLYLLRE